MFKSGRWKSEKKIKILFGMQFQATQVPQLKAKSLMVSLVPADAGKPSVRVGKACIVDGSCNWENPIYETVKLVKETATGKFKEKIYYLTVSSGSSKKGFLGEACIDFSDFAETNGPLIVSMPLQASDSGAILHVTVQRMQPNPDERGSEVHEDESNGKILVKEDKNYDRDIDDELISSAQNDDISKNPPLNENVPTYRHCRSFTDWSSESASDRSMIEIDKGSQDNFRYDTVQEGSNGIDNRFENRIRLLERQVEVSELEIQSLRKQIAKEGKKEQELSNQICSLQDERDSIRTKYEQLKLLPRFVNDVEGSNDTEKLRGQFEDIKKLRLRLQKTEDKNSELILAIRDLNEKLNQKNKDMKAPKELFEDEITELKQKIKDMDSEIEVHINEKEELKIHVEDLSLDYEILRKENEEITSSIDKYQIEKNKMQRQNSESLTNVKQFKLEVVRLEEEIRKGELQYSDSLKMNKELEAQIKSLAHELELQALDFEDEMEVITREKIEQENRAVKAEESFRKLKGDNANLVEEFTRISIEMAHKIDENEKISTVVKVEADDLRIKNHILEESLQKAKEEYEIKIQGLSDSINMDTKQRMRSNKEKEELKIEIANAKKELDEKKKTEEKIHLEMGKFRVQNDELRLYSGELKSENEKLQMEVNRLKSNFQHKKEGVSKKNNDAPSNSKLLEEVTALKERNKHMEDELKEMQDRYSDISLKFAEVEGERQELVMAVRNLKSGKKQ